MEPLENMEIHELPSTLVCKWMEGRGKFGRIGVQGDGSCFFHSVCSILNLNDYLFASKTEQRKIAYTFRCDFSKHFTLSEYSHFLHKSKSKSNSPTLPNVDEFQKKNDDFCVPKTWADEIMIRYASKATDINIIFLDLESGKAYCGVHGEEAEREQKEMKSVTQKTGIIAWVKHSHFEPVVRIDDAENGIITTLFEPENNEEDSELVNFLMNTYSSSCDLLV